MKKKKGVCVKSTVFVLLLLMGALFAVMDTSTVAAATDGSYTYTVGGTPLVATITDYSGAGGAITIPSTLGSSPAYTTKIIGSNAFKSKASITSVVIPSSVTTISNNAFESCTALTSVTIPDSVTSIDDFAFYNCPELTSVTIPNSVTSIGGGAFSYDYALTSVIIGNGVVTIGGGAFSYGQSLTSLTIGSGVTTIESGAFYDCGVLASISFLGMTAPSVGLNWLGLAPSTVRGHAYSASNFPAPAGVWNTLTMGDYIISIPGAPTSISATPGNAQATITWGAPADNGGSPIINYKLYRSATSSGTYSLLASPLGLTYTDTGLTNGQTYWYRASAVNVDGEGANSTQINASLASSSTDNTLLYVVIAIAIIAALATIAIIAIAVVVMRRKK